MEKNIKQKTNWIKFLLGHEKITKVDMLEILTALALAAFLISTFVMAY